MNAQKIEWSLDNRDDENEYRDMLDEIFGDVKIAGLDYATSTALINVDEVAYRTGFVDWSDGQDERWQCQECFTMHDNEEDAEECCKEEE